MELLKKMSGVYKITCTGNGEFYIGSAVKFKQRWKHHKFLLKSGKHNAKYMLNSWNKYGEESFKFEILVVCAKDMVLFYEQLFLDAFKPKFNTLMTAGNALGHKYSDEVKQKFSKAQRNWRKKYEWKSEQLCLSDIAAKENFDYKLLMARVLGLGKTVQESIDMGEDSRNRFYEHEGKSQRIKEWAIELNLNPAKLRHYLDRGLTIAEILSKLARDEKRMSFAELCRITGANLPTAKSRVQKGMSIMEALTIPALQRDNSWRYKEVA